MKDYIACIYSIIEKLSITDLKNGNFSHGININKISIWMKNNNISFSYKGDSTYHYKFLNFSSSPYLYYYLGNIDILNKKIIGIVGPRIYNNYGEYLIKSFFDFSKNYDFATISGLASGIDTISHYYSIKNNIPTIAILGGGIKYYFENNEKQILIKKIVENGGLIISQYKLNFIPTKYSFPQRNRIISGLSDCLFIPQAGKKSGSLITADFAYNQGKPVYGVMGDINSPFSYGINKYISNNKAKGVYDIFQFVKDIFGDNKSLFDFNKDEIKIINIMKQYGGIDISKLNYLLKMNLDILMEYLTSLEIKGKIYQSFPGIYELTNKNS